MEIRLARVLQRLAAITALLASAAARADVCVSCAGPDAAYACTVAGVSMSKDDARYKLLCITELAKLGGHQSCAVSRAVTAPCPGEPKTIAAPVGAGGLDEPLIASPPAETSTPPGGADGQPASNQATTTTVPKTTTQGGEQAQGDGGVEGGDAAEKTDNSAAGLAKSTGDAMEKAGKAVTDAAKSTWKCLSTLFGDC